MHIKLTGCLIVSFIRTVRLCIDHSLFTFENCQLKNRCMTPELICPNMAVDVNVVLEDILALSRGKHIVSKKRTLVQTKM